MSASFKRWAILCENIIEKTHFSPGFIKAVFYNLAGKYGAFLIFEMRQFCLQNFYPRRNTCATERMYILVSIIISSTYPFSINSLKWNIWVNTSYVLLTKSTKRIFINYNSKSLFINPFIKIIFRTLRKRFL